MRLILASKSPRRIELLKSLCASFEICPAELDEDAFTLPDPYETATLLAIAKARKVASQFPQDTVIGSDTVVALPQPDGSFIQFSKPTDPDNALMILSELVGKTHFVITAVTVIVDDKVFASTDTAEVQFNDVSERQLRDYIETAEPMDKAGAYGAQGKGGFLIKELRGDFQTVVGFPLQLVEKLLVESGYLTVKRASV